MMGQAKRVLIVGGVAGGASCAARLRRLDEKAEIVLFDRGPYVSFANCGLPYYVGDVIQEEDDLLVASPELFRKQFEIDVRVLHEVARLDRPRREIIVRDIASDRVFRESYDALVLAPGAAPVCPDLPGIELPGIFAVRTIPDCREIKNWIAARQPRKAVVAGASYIGLEMTENLVQRGLAVTVVDVLPQVMAALDPEMAEPVVRHLETNLIDLQLGDAVAGFEAGEKGSLIVKTESGKFLPADLVILSLGVKPETTLARSAGLEIGGLGGIRVDDAMRTSDPAIWAVGDAVEVRSVVTGKWCLMPLAGPANRQGRVAADSICGRGASFRGVQGTAVCSVFGLTVAVTGASERALRQAGISDYEVVYLHPNSHASYYPGAKRLHMKLIFSRHDGRILGGQAVGEDGADKRIDVVSMAIQKGGTVFDLEECELSYAPQCGSAKDPVNMAGMIAANVLRGDMPLAKWDDLGRTPAFVIDVREPSEYAAGHIDGIVNVPLSELRTRLAELPCDREIWVYCAVGQRAYYAVRILLQNGFAARNLPGGYLTYWGFNP
jgi:NADPH-dependent 2,4-dienoyl-CoA reductase/sulfur reductase-like enzyme/rhodanese-related sulfurtransferase